MEEKEDTIFAWSILQSIWELSYKQIHDSMMSIVKGIHKRGSRRANSSLPEIESLVRGFTECLVIGGSKRHSFKHTKVELSRQRHGKALNVMIIPPFSYLVIILELESMKDLRDPPVQPLHMTREIQREAVFCPSYPVNQQ